jgi:hypothetical protein
MSNTTNDKGRNRPRTSKHNKNKDGINADRAFSMSQTLPKSMVYPPSQVCNFVSSSEAIAFHTTSTTLNTTAAATFTPSTIVGDFVSYAAVFDQYRLDHIEIWMFPRVTTGDGIITNPGLMSSVIDFDDGSILSGPAAAQDYANCITSPGTMGHYRRFKPHAAIAAYTGAFGGFANTTSPWIDASSGTVQHYGFKTACTPTSTTLYYDLAIRVHTSWRNQR